MKLSILRELGSKCLILDISYIIYDIKFSFIILYPFLLFQKKGSVACIFMYH